MTRRLRPVPRLAVLLAVATLAACGGGRDRAVPDEPPMREVAPITVQRAAPFVALPLDTEVYRHSMSGLRDLRVVDARGERVPHALLEPDRDRRTRARAAEPLAVYPLLPRRAGRPAGHDSGAAIDVVVQGDRIEIRRQRERAVDALREEPSPGLLVDTGERRTDRPPVRGLELAWGGDRDVSLGLRVETSDDLVAWRPAGAGMLVSMAPAPTAAGGMRLEQRQVALPDTTAGGRFVRLAWDDPAAAPPAIQAWALVDQTERATVRTQEVSAPGRADPANPRAVVFDFGAELPLDELSLRIEGGTRVLPGVLQRAVTGAGAGAAAGAGSQPAAATAWRDERAVVFHRLVRDGQPTVESPPLAFGATVRTLRLVVDARAALPPPASLALVGRYRPATLVFPSQGEPPWQLRAGATVADGALPIGVLVPDLARERASFGAATLGPFGIDRDAAARHERELRAQQRRPLVLWGVLVLGVALLGAMVWRLARR